MSEKRFAVIPTRTERATLWPLLEVLIEADVTPILILTKEDVDERVFENERLHLHWGTAKMSISYWWNMGIDHVESTQGQHPVLVLNDDLGMTVGQVNVLFEALEDNHLVWAMPLNDQMHTPFSGSCFGLWAGNLRIDERYTWWHGDDDLYRRAREQGLRCKAVDIAPTHVRTETYERWDETMFKDVIPIDQELYFERWKGTPYA